jgi:hypothetical protein
VIVPVLLCYRGGLGTDEARAVHQGVWCGTVRNLTPPPPFTRLRQSRPLSCENLSHYRSILSLFFSIFECVPSWWCVGEAGQFEQV